MHVYTVPFTTQALHVSALEQFAPELTFLPVADAPAVGPFVYVLTAPNGAIVYPGKSDTSTPKRPREYVRWVAAYRAEVEASGRPDVMDDFARGDLEHSLWLTIVRYAAHHSLTPLVASVAGTGENGAVWEARIQTLAGILTGNESIVGGSGWEREADSLRFAAAAWARERIASLRA